jgi:RimJ/RimL family protein N-acetyltransferase
MSLDDAKKLREEREADSSRLSFNIWVTDPDSGKKSFAGSTAIHQINTMHETCHVGILISPDFYGQGIATITFYLIMRFIFEETAEGTVPGKPRKPPLNRITFETGIDNKPMQMWLEKTAGIRREGVMLELFKDPDNGGFTDLVTYGILRSEWMGKVKERLEQKLGIGH